MTEYSVPHLILVITATLLATRVLGWISQRLGQPSVVGELIAGVILGSSVLGLLDPSEHAIHVLSEIGVIILLFEIGLHTDLKGLMKVGNESVVVALVGVVLPFGAGYAVASALGLAAIPSIVCGAALTATSISISARTLSDLGRLQTAEGQIVLGAAVLDDIVGLVILAVVSRLVGGAELTIGGVSLIAVFAIGFVIAALFLGKLLIPPVFRMLGENTWVLGVAGIIFAMILALLASKAGSASIIGAFSAGLILHETPQRGAISKSTARAGMVFVPIFFAAVGAAVDIGTLRDPTVLKIGAALIVVGVIGKFLAGYAIFWFKGRKSLIGIAMIPRGEVGLIFARMGLATAALTPHLYSAIAAMVLVTTFITPPLLTWNSRGKLSRSSRS